MENWKIEKIEFDPQVAKVLREFVKNNPSYKRMLDARVNDLMNFPELIWTTAVFDRKDSNTAEFVTYHQQIDLAGKVYRTSKAVYITHFEFHR